MCFQYRSTSTGCFSRYTSLHWQLQNVSSAQPRCILLTWNWACIKTFIITCTLQPLFLGFVWLGCVTDNVIKPTLLWSTVLCVAVFSIFETKGLFYKISVTVEGNDVELAQPCWNASSLANHHELRDIHKTVSSADKSIFSSYNYDVIFCGKSQSQPVRHALMEANS